MARSDDILVDISDDDLWELAEIYKYHQHYAPHVNSLIKIGIKWKKSEKFRNLITFMSPNNSWRQDGTIIVLMEFSCYDIFVFTLDNNNDKIYEGLAKTSRLNFDNRTLFFSIHNNHIDEVEKFINEKNFYVSAKVPCVSYALSQDEAKNFPTDCPPEVYLKKLEPSAVPQINAIWPHSYPDSDKYIATLIEANGGYGVFLKSTNEMVAWVLMQTLGILDMLQTEEKYKRRGYAGLAVKTLCREMAEEGLTPCGNVLVENYASRNLFEKTLKLTEIGRVLGTTFYVEVFPSHQKWCGFYNITN